MKNMFRFAAVLAVVLIITTAFIVSSVEASNRQGVVYHRLSADIYLNHKSCEKIIDASEYVSLLITLKAPEATSKALGVALFAHNRTLKYLSAANNKNGVVIRVLYPGVPGNPIPSMPYPIWIRSQRDSDSRAKLSDGRGLGGRFSGSGGNGGGGGSAQRF